MFCAQRFALVFLHLLRLGEGRCYLFLPGRDYLHKVISHFFCRDIIFRLHNVKILRLGIQSRSYQCRQDCLRMNLMPSKLQGIIQAFLKRKTCLQQRINIVIIAIQTPDGYREKFHSQCILCIYRFEVVVSKTGM